KNKETALKAYEKLHTYWAELDRQLKDKNYLVGERLTLADIDIVCLLFGCFKYLMPPEIRSKYPNLVRYFKAIIFLPHFQACFTQLKSEEDFATSLPEFLN
ncbi:Elongation factor 1-gamma, partial [Massospora cicadina]